MFLFSPYFSMSNVLCVESSSTELYFNMFFLYLSEYKFVAHDFPSSDIVSLNTSPLYNVVLFFILSPSELSVSIFETNVSFLSSSALYSYFVVSVLFLFSSSSFCTTSFMNPSLLVTLVVFSLYS